MHPEMIDCMMSRKIDHQEKENSHDLDHCHPARPLAARILRPERFLWLSARRQHRAHPARHRVDPLHSRSAGGHLSPNLLMTGEAACLAASQNTIPTKCLVPSRKGEFHEE